MRPGQVRDCFEGVIPSVIATLGEDGAPNVSYLSQVHYIDDDHVALSNQFFSKTARNVKRLNTATLMVVDGRTGEQHILAISYVRSEEAGPLFARMSAHLQVIDGHAVMKLKSVDIYRVHSLTSIAALSPLSETPPRLPPRTDLERLSRFCLQLTEASDADALIEAALDGIETHLGISHAILLVADGEGALTTLAHRGYGGREGVGAEVRAGEGLIGLSADIRQPMRICDFRRAQRYASAVAASHQADPRHIPLPGLETALSQMAVPLIHQAQLCGVLFVESDTAFAFNHEDEAALSILASQLAAGLKLHDAPDASGPETSGPEASGPAPVSTPETPAGPSFRLRHHPFDDSVFIDDTYLIRGVSGRLLHNLIRAYLDTGKVDFSNREIRRDASLKLPDFKDNLETRLILLRRRLDEKDAPIRLERTDRGRFRLSLSGQPVIETV
ncbi:MAG: GAF domain-containing protein [Asticcacaulis sp.]